MEGEGRLALQTCCGAGKYPYISFRKQICGSVWLNCTDSVDDLPYSHWAYTEMNREIRNKKSTASSQGKFKIEDHVRASQISPSHHIIHFHAYSYQKCVSPAAPVVVPSSFGPCPSPPSPPCPHWPPSPMQPPCPDSRTWRFQLYERAVFSRKFFRRHSRPCPNLRIRPYHQRDDMATLPDFRNGSVREMTARARHCFDARHG